MWVFYCFGYNPWNNYERHAEKLQRRNCSSDRAFGVDSEVVRWSPTLYETFFLKNSLKNINSSVEMNILPVRTVFKYQRYKNTSISPERVLKSWDRNWLVPVDQVVEHSVCIRSLCWFEFHTWDDNFFIIFFRRPGGSVSKEVGHLCARRMDVIMWWVLSLTLAKVLVNRLISQIP